MYRYETHMHTLPVSNCAQASVRENLQAYQKWGYDGVFITNHFIDSNIGIDRSRPYEERVEFYFSDYEEAKIIGAELGIRIFDGVELSYKGTDFLVYGLHKDWFLAHPEIEGMKKTEELALMRAAGALIIQAHPFREAKYINHIRLFPRNIHGVEVFNASRTDFENRLAEQFADNYGLIHFAGSDNHQGGARTCFGGMESEIPVNDEQDFIRKVLDGTLKPFQWTIE